MGYFPVSYDSRVVNYDCRGFIRLAAGISLVLFCLLCTVGECSIKIGQCSDSNLVPLVLVGSDHGANFSNECFRKAPKVLPALVFACDRIK